MLNYIFSPLRKGINLMKHDRLPEAAEFFKKLITKGARAAESYVNLGRCYHKMERFAEAKACLIQVLKYDPSPELIHEILEITNWQMVSSSRYFNQWPSFSPDGNTLVYVSSRKDTNNDGKINAIDCGGIYAFRFDTGTERNIVPDEFRNMMPVFSPDGRYLAYLSARSDGVSETTFPQNLTDHSLYLLDIATGAETLLLDKSFRIKHLNFSPNGGKIIFVCWRPGDKNSGIYALDIATLKMESMATGLHENTFPSLSPSGNRLLYSSWRRDTNGDGFIDLRDNTGIYLKNLATGVETNISPDIYNNSFPVFSPDGEKAMYLSVRRDTNGDGRITSLDNPGIYLYNIKGRSWRCIMKDKFYNKFANFTPEGREIVFISNWCTRTHKYESDDFFENKGIYCMTLNSRKIRQIVSDKYYGCRSLVLSPKGDRIAYVSWRKNTNRGLYSAFLHRLPSHDELRSWIENNI